MTIKTKIIAHRGFSEKYPENTLTAFKEAVRSGADAIELDVHLSLDKKLIVHHDYDLAHPTNAKGLIPSTESTYIRTLDAGVWFNEKFTGEKIPFLDEVFEQFGKGIKYEIELKGYTKEFVSVIMNLVQKYDLLENIEFTSPHTYLLAYIKSNYPNIKVGMFANPFPEWMDLPLGKTILKSNALLGHFTVLHLQQSLLSKEYLLDLHENDLLVHAADCNTKDTIKNALSLGVDQLSTNMADLAVSLREAHEEQRF